MIKRALLLALLAIGAGTVVGCIRVHADSPAGVNAVIEPQFITSPVRLSGCEAKSSPLRCKRVQFSYRKGAEVLQVHK
jgi:hypothetical protein